MPRKKNEHIINCNGEILKLREGESRKVNMPVLLRLEGGVLYITPPDVMMARDLSKSFLPIEAFDLKTSGG